MPKKQRQTFPLKDRTIFRIRGVIRIVPDAWGYADESGYELGFWPDFKLSYRRLGLYLHIWGYKSSSSDRREVRLRCNLGRWIEISGKLRDGQRKEA